MPNFLNLETDFRRWILFNRDLNDFQNLYDLHKAVQTGRPAGVFSIRQESVDGEPKFILEQEGNESSLALDGDSARDAFLGYLQQHFLSNEDIETWYQSKRQSREKSINHLGPEQTVSEDRFIRVENIPPHPREPRYYKLRVFFSALAYLAILAYVIGNFFISTTMGVASVVSIAMTILFFAFIRRMAQGIFIGMMKGSSVRINEKQYPEIFDIVRTQAQAIGIGTVPEVFVAYGEFNAFVTKLARRKYLMLHSQVVETALKGDYEVLKFVVGHELGHLKRKHLSIEGWLWPSLFIPFLKKAHSRACEYTCDRIGYHFSSRGAIEGVLIMSTGKEIHSKINVNRLIDDAVADKGFWFWLSEKFLTHPHITKRLWALRSYGQRGY